MLLIKITERIQEIEIFYEDNIHDFRITNFEKVRLRLKKLLMYEVEILKKVDMASGKFANSSINKK